MTSRMQGMSKYPLAINVDFGPGRQLVYDSRVNLLFSMSNEQLAQLEAGGKDLHNQVLPMLEHLNSSGVLLPGGRDSLFDASPEHIDRIIDHNATNVLMRKYVLEVTQDCNFRCKYCSNTIETTWRHHRRRDMSAQTAKKAVDYYFKIYTDFLKRVPEKYYEAFLKRNRPSLSFYGGEPTMNFDIVQDATAYMKSLPWEEYGIDKDDIIFTSNTNLSRLDSDMLEFLTSNSFILYASLDGPASEHDKNRVDVAGGPTFARAYRNLMKIKEYDAKYFKERVTILAVEAPDHDHKAAHEFLDGLGCRISYLPMSTYGCFIDDPVAKLKELEEHEDEIIENALRAYKENPEKELSNYTKMAYHRLNIEGESESDGLLPTCPVATDNLMVDVDGNLHICHKTDGSFVLGNVDDGLNRDALRKFYGDLARASDCEECRNCWAVRECGQCAAVRLRGGSFVNPHEDECRYIRKSALIDLRIFARLLLTEPRILDRLDEYVNDPDRYEGVIDLSTIKWEKYLPQSGN